MWHRNAPSANLQVWFAQSIFDFSLGVVLPCWISSVSWCHRNDSQITSDYASKLKKNVQSASSPSEHAVNLGLIWYNSLFIYKNGLVINMSFSYLNICKTSKVSGVDHFPINFLILLLFHYYSYTTCKVLICKYCCCLFNLSCTILILFSIMEIYLMF